MRESISSEPSYIQNELACSLKHSNTCVQTRWASSRCPPTVNDPPVRSPAEVWSCDGPTVLEKLQGSIPNTLKCVGRFLGGGELLIQLFLPSQPLKFPPTCIFWTLSKQVKWLWDLEIRCWISCPRGERRKRWQMWQKGAKQMTWRCPGSLW